VEAGADVVENRETLKIHGNIASARPGLDDENVKMQTRALISFEGYCVESTQKSSDFYQRVVFKLPHGGKALRQLGANPGNA
jgi:hypothetical protein